MDIPSDLIITMSDITRAGHCGRGTRKFFDDCPDLPDFRTFLRSGVSATALAATGDARALQVVSRTIRNRGDG